MKTIAFRSALLLAAVVRMVGCGRSDGLIYPEPTEGGTHSVVWLKSQCRGESRLLTEDIAVRGRVVANDCYGEWSRSLVIADETGGITIFADDSQLADRYPFGAAVVLYVNGLRLYDYGGKVVVGSAIPSAYGFGLEPTAITAHLHRDADFPSPPEPRTVSVGNIAAEHVDTYVRITGVRFLEQGCWCDKDPATGRYVDTDRTVVDDAGHRFRIRTKGGCAYAKEPLPSGKGSLCGVVDYFNGDYSLRVVNREVDFP